MSSAKNIYTTLPIIDQKIDNGNVFLDYIYTLKQSNLWIDDLELDEGYYLLYQYGKENKKREI